MESLEEVLQVAKGVLEEQYPNNTRLYRLARYLMDNLGEDAPCGWEAPDKSGAGYIQIPNSWVAFVSPDDARSLAKMLIVAAEGK